MTRSINEVRVVGLGKVGELVATLLADSGFSVTAYDARERSDLPFATKSLDVRDARALRDALTDADAVVSCLPFNLNLGVAEAAFEVGVHYFDLTEDVPTTNRVLELSAQNPSHVMAPQCGLAPGLIGIIGSSLTKKFTDIRSIELKVGALPRHPSGLLGYAFNWSSEGVVNEYLNDCEVLRSGHRQMVPAMTEHERVVIGGIELEASLTSGGLGTMCETYEGRAQRLDYKTMRYPGHFELMRFFFDELGLRERRELAGEILVNAKPPTNDDVVYLHAAVEGVQNGQLFRENYVRAYQPLDINGRSWRAISWTTAASAVAVVELVAEGRLPQSGFIKQEDIPFEALLSTKNGVRFAEEGKV
ncbi:saccharopine dehydrogenase NADP-binding domain-containing protein [Jatrophihabitans telluris]|uniref:Saccharopine dehydrogenase NADP-binding domain-containing protein n=1 Tax=Jatrophihabitans telluris TaxID=2038343 RepID=A0ABY4QXS4_9ACTN|nr:saccharopine dehydrogenase C-terminal domain-containing protein [Jatrophihabitans telluris]UQX87690.1 saccharopine dehydrogenase NADP-binding domain-containing protein [Jatrophihabitans telluris]